MPAIIAAPARTRNSQNAISDSDLEQYVALMFEAEDGQIVTVDESERVGYEAAYARGERVRVALNKRTDMVGIKVQVVSYKVDPEDTGDRNTATYAAGVRIRKQ